MKADKSMHSLEMRKNRGVSPVSTNEGGQKHTLPRHKETMVNVSAVNMNSKR